MEIGALTSVLGIAGGADSGSPEHADYSTFVDISAPEVDLANFFNQAVTATDDDVADEADDATPAGRGVALIALGKRAPATRPWESQTARWRCEEDAAAERADPGLGARRTATVNAARVAADVHQARA